MKKPFNKRARKQRQHFAVRKDLYLKSDTDVYYFVTLIGPDDL